jgi:hypothetical protein
MIGIFHFIVLYEGVHLIWLLKIPMEFDIFGHSCFQGWFNVFLVIVLV